VENIDRLVENLCTIWFGRTRLHANLVRFQKAYRNTTSQPHKPKVGNSSSSFTSVLKSGIHHNVTSDQTSPAMVLDDSCFSERDLKVGSWSSVLKPACNSSVTDERIVWISLEGLPLKVWSQNTFLKIASKWGTTNSFTDEDYEGDESRYFRETKNDIDSNLERVSESSCMQDNDLLYDNAKNVSGVDPLPEESKDPFRIYDILKKKKESGEHSKEEDLTHPPGFTPNIENMEEEYVNEGGVNEKEANVRVKSILNNLNKSFSPGSIFLTCNNGSHNIKTGGSFLELTEKRELWNYLSLLIDRWESEYVILGDSNEVRLESERFGSLFNVQGANAFNNFISMASVIDLPLEALCLDRDLSDHRPIIMRELNYDYGLTPFRIFHSWFEMEGEDHHLKKLSEIDKILDQEGSNVEMLNTKAVLLKELHDINMAEYMEMAQRAKIRWAIEGDENSKYFHGILNQKRSQMAICGILVDGEWLVEPSRVKDEFLTHFSHRFSKPDSFRICPINHHSNRLTADQIEELECNISHEEVKRAVYDCGTNKTPGPDGFTFEFFRRYWKFLEMLWLL
ncbi:hypothetical protein Tco_0642334, partial [Tanacetum coccineum]